MPNKILIPILSLVSCFFEPPKNRRVAVGATEGLWRGYSSICPKGTICWTPVTVTQAGGGFSVLNLLCAKDQANENWVQVRYLADFPAGYEGDSLACFSHCFFLLSFSNSLLELEPGQNPWCLASGPNEAQVLDVSLKKNQWETERQVRGGFVQIQREAHSTEWVWWPWNVVWLVDFIC